MLLYFYNGLPNFCEKISPLIKRYSAFDVTDFSDDLENLMDFECSL
jgi:hypothetical protein